VSCFRPLWTEYEYQTDAYYAGTGLSIDFIAMIKSRRINGWPHSKDKVLIQNCDRESIWEEAVWRRWAFFKLAVDSLRARMRTYLNRLEWYTKCRVFVDFKSPAKIMFFLAIPCMKQNLGLYIYVNVSAMLLLLTLLFWTFSVWCTCEEMQIRITLFWDVRTNGSVDRPQRSWRGRQQVLPKRWFLSTNLHGIASQKTIMLLIFAGRARNKHDIFTESLI
jgi:type IV secretory pathway VirB3-like protein